MSSRIVLVDALRGLAALVVLWHHIFVLFPVAQALSTRPVLRAAAEWLSDRNVEAVLMFFVLSGFSIHLSARKLDMRERKDVNEYLYRRFRRILPLYGLSLLLAGVIGWTVAPAQPSSLTITTLLGNLAFLQTSAAVPGVWFEPYAQNGPLWSLSYEMFYYLAFPPLLLLRSARTRLLVVCGLTFAGLAVQQVWPNPIASFNASFLIWYLGCELADLYLSGRTAVPLWCFSLLGLCIVAVLSVRASATLSLLATGLLFFHFGYGLIVLSRACSGPERERGPERARVNSVVDRVLVGPFAWVGGFSYGLYLLHYPVLRAVAAVTSDALAIALGVLVALSLAYVVETRTAHRELRWLRRRYV